MICWNFSLVRFDPFEHPWPQGPTLRWVVFIGIFREIPDSASANIFSVKNVWNTVLHPGNQSVRVVTYQNSPKKSCILGTSAGEYPWPGISSSCQLVTRTHSLKGWCKWPPIGVYKKVAFSHLVTIGFSGMETKVWTSHQLGGEPGGPQNLLKISRGFLRLQQKKTIIHMGSIFRSPIFLYTPSKTIFFEGEDAVVFFLNISWTWVGL